LWKQSKKDVDGAKVVKKWEKAYSERIRR